MLFCTAAVLFYVLTSSVPGVQELTPWRQWLKGLGAALGGDTLASLDVYYVQNVLLGRSPKLHCAFLTELALESAVSFRERAPDS